MDLKDDQEVEANIKLIVSSGKCFGNPKRFYEFIERLSVLHFISFHFIFRQFRKFIFFVDNNCCTT